MCITIKINLSGTAMCDSEFFVLRKRSLKFLASVRRMFQQVIFAVIRLKVVIKKTNISLGIE